LLKERIFFDENIYSAATTGRLSVDEWRRSIRNRRCKCVLTALTLVELLEWLRVAPDDNSFRTAQTALNLAWDFGGKHILEFPQSFLSDRLFGIKGAPLGFSRADLQVWLKVGIRARSRKELSEGLVARTESQRRTYGLDLSTIRESLNRGREVLNDQISEAVAEICPEYESVPPGSSKPPLTKTKLAGIDRVIQGDKLKARYAAKIVEFCQLPRTIEPTPEVITKVMTSVDAHFTHSCFIKRQALTTSYNYRRDTGLIVDSELLFYLADPSCVLVTNDGRLRKAIAHSSQSARVISFAEFRTQAAGGAPTGQTVSLCRYS
jgi:hypothetical protein